MSSPTTHPATGPKILTDAGLADIFSKVEAGERLSAADGLRLFETPNLAAVGWLANRVKERLHGERVWFNRNLHINATNVCEASCVFCSFARLKTGDAEAWTLSLDQATARLREADGALVTEVHIVNGLNPDLPWDYYPNLLRALKAVRPEIHIKGFTAVEIHYYAQKYGMTVEQVLRDLRAAGLDSLPGGGAEIFHPRARKKLCDDKVDADGWLAIHQTAHRLGMRSNCTMLFGSIETLEERVDHLIRLRELQDQSLAWAAEQVNATEEAGTGEQNAIPAGSFQTFIPLRFHNENNRLARLASPTGWDSLRTIAVSRLLLDNIPHVKAYWPMLGTNEAQVALHFGASDLDGTVKEEHIYHMAGAETPQGLSRTDLLRFVTDARRQPLERTTTYELIRLDTPIAEGGSAATGSAYGIQPTHVSVSAQWRGARTFTKGGDSVVPLTEIQGMGFQHSVQRHDAVVPTEAPLPAPPPARLGWVDYTNALPLVKHLDKTALSLRGGHPWEVARWLRDGEIDLALLPVGALLTDTFPAPGLQVVPDLCIGADGPVETVILAADGPPDTWDMVLLDGVSRTSAILARLLLTTSALQEELKPGVSILDVPAGRGLKNAGGNIATLVIGDAAHQLGDRLPWRLDLAEAWKAFTGLPFVFAVWAGRADLDPAVVAHVHAAGLRGIAEIARGELPPNLSITQQRYLREKIRYTLDDRATMGLMRFAALGHRANLLRRQAWGLYPPPLRLPAQSPNLRAALATIDAGQPLYRADLQVLHHEAPLSELLLRASPRAERPASFGLPDPAVLPLPTLHIDPKTLPSSLPEHPFRAVLHFATGEGPEDLVDALLWLRAGGEALRAVSFAVGAPGLHWAAGEDNPSYSNGIRPSEGEVGLYTSEMVVTDEGTNRSAVAFLRLLALARIVLGPRLPIQAPHSLFGRGIAQLALHAGADDIGLVSPTLPSAEMKDGVWPMTEREAVRCIHQVGLRPHRRDPSFAISGEEVEGPETGILRRLDRRS